MARHVLPNGCVVRSGRLSSSEELYLYKALDSKPITMSMPSAKRRAEPDAIADEEPKGSKATKPKINESSDYTTGGQEG